MWPVAAIIGAAAVKAGGQLGGSYLNYLGNVKAAEKTANATERANLANLYYQQQFAQNGISWRKQDALNAGINPIYALGAQGAQFTPSFQAEQYGWDNSVGQGIANATGELADFFSETNQLELQKEKIELEKQRQENEVSLIAAQTTEALQKADLYATERLKLEKDINKMVTAMPLTKENGVSLKILGLGNLQAPYGKQTRIPGTGISISPLTEKTGFIVMSDKDLQQSWSDSRTESFMLRNFGEMIMEKIGGYWTNDQKAIITDDGNEIVINWDKSMGMPALYYEIKETTRAKKESGKLPNVESIRKAGINAVKEKLGLDESDFYYD